MGVLATWRNQFDLVDVAGRLADIRTSGSGRGLMCCPFHAETTPSCALYQDHFHCYGCGQHGDVLDLVQRLRACTFEDAIDWLADTFAVAPPSRSPEAEAWFRSLRDLRTFLGENLDHTTRPLPGGLSLAQAQRLGLGLGEGLSAYVSRLARPVMSPADAARFDGHWSIDLASPSVDGVGFLVRDRGGIGRIARVGTRHMDGVAGLVAARAVMSRERPMLFVADLDDFFRCQAGDEVEAVTLGRQPLSASLATVLAELSPSIRFRPASGPLGSTLHDALTLTSAGAVVLVEANGEQRTLFETVAAHDVNAPATDQVASRFLAAIPSDSSRRLYAAELSRRGIASLGAGHAADCGAGHLAR